MQGRNEARQSGLGEAQVRLVAGEKNKIYLLKFEKIYKFDNRCGSRYSTFDTPSREAHEQASSS